MKASVTEWGRWPNFSAAEFRCQHTGADGMDATFMDRLQALRADFGKPMVISSGYRDPSHPIEAAKPQPGAHASGRACDVRVEGGEALELVALAYRHGFTGIGVQQKGGGRFIHLDDLPHAPNRPRPWIWSY